MNKKAVIPALGILAIIGVAIIIGLAVLLKSSFFNIGLGRLLGYVIVVLTIYAFFKDDNRTEHYIPYLIFIGIGLFLVWNPIASFKLNTLTLKDLLVKP